MRTFATLGGAITQRNQFRTTSRPACRRHSAASNTTLSLVAGLTVGLAACGDKDTIVGLAQIDGGRLLANAALLVVQGASQEGEVAAKLDKPLVVEVRDITTATMPNVLVEWVFEDGKGIGADGNPADTVRVRTGSDGQASVMWQLDTIAGEQVATARIVPLEAPAAGEGTPGLTAQEWLQQFMARGRAGVLRSISISPDNPTINMGDSVQLVARGRDRYGNLLTVQPAYSWLSSAVGVARVDARGMVVAAGGGVATVTATSGSVSGQETVTVTATTPQPPRVAQVGLDPAGATLSVGDTVRFRVSAFDSVGSPLSVSSAQWGTRSGSITSVNSSGLLTALTAGSDSVWASVSGVRAARPITVTAPAQSPGAVTSLVVASITGNSVRLRWTQVSDGTGAPARYALRYDTPSVSWGSAYATDVRIQGTQVGAAIEYTWTGLAAGTSYGFQVVAYREGSGGSGIYGALSNVISATTTAATVTVVGVDVRPNSASGTPGSALAFTATALMSDGSQQPTQVTWTATGGTSASNGLYTAGSVPGTYRVVGRHSLGFADTSAVSITATPPPPPPGAGSPFFRMDYSGTSLAGWSGMRADNANYTMTRVPGIGSGGESGYRMQMDFVGPNGGDDYWGHNRTFTGAPFAYGDRVYFRWRYRWTPGTDCRAYAQFGTGQLAGVYRNKILIVNDGSSSATSRFIMTAECTASSSSYYWRLQKGGGVEPAQTPNYPITSAWMDVQVEIQYSSAPGRNDGAYRIWVNNSSQANPTAQSTGIPMYADVQPGYVQFGAYFNNGLYPGGTIGWEHVGFEIDDDFDPAWDR